jgi:hypothetical protein
MIKQTYRNKVKKRPMVDSAVNMSSEFEQSWEFQKSPKS